MRKQLSLIVLISFSCFELFSQIIFENGYFINESNRTIECFIKNIDWKNTPMEFEYKLSKNDSVYKADVNNVKEFGINNISRYIRVKVKIDRSSDQIDEMGTDREPVFNEEILFLKLLIEGQLSLYQYIDGNLTRYFYKLNDSEIQQLVFKKYLSDYIILENNSFKQELLLKLKCDDILPIEIENLRYSQKDLEELFIKYNECAGKDYINYERKKGPFNFTVRPGLNYGSLKINNSTSDIQDFDFGYEAGIRLGIETEFVLPFNKNKWGILIEPTYQYYKSGQSKEVSYLSDGILISEVEYKSIELPLGLRHYFYLNDKSKLFTNISYVFDFSINSSVKFFRRDYVLLSELEILSRRNLAFGLGYKYNDRWSLEIRYNTNRHILSDYLYWNSDYNAISFVAGFSIPE